MEKNSELVLPRAPEGYSQTQAAEFNKEVNSNMEYILKRAQSWTRNTNAAIGRRQGTFTVAKIAYYPCETELNRMITRIFGTDYMKDAETKKEYQKAVVMQNLVPNEPIRGLVELVDGEFTLVEDGQYRYGTLQIRDMKIDDKNIRGYTFRNIIPVLSLYPNSMITQELTRGMNENDTKIYFEARDILGSRWSIHCNTQEYFNK